MSGEQALGVHCARYLQTHGFSRRFFMGVNPAIQCFNNPGATLGSREFIRWLFFGLDVVAARIVHLTSSNKYSE